MLTEGTLVAGRYLVTARLGQGGMGAVYLVRDQRLGRQAALKVFAARPEATALARFRREARIMARLRHPNLAAVYETVEVEGLPALVQEYVEGRDLQELLRCGAPLDASSCRRMLGQVASALALLHESGVVHRDVKPGNVMVEPGGRFRLMDLGLARADDMTAVTETGSVVGTPMFVAPNVLMGRPAGPADDVYALGLLVNIMATGTHLHGPLEQGNAFLVAVAQGRFEGQPASPGLAPDLARVVNACCRFEPAGRPANGAAVLELMRSPCAESAPATAVGSADAGGTRRSRLARTGALATTAVLLLGGALLGLRSRTPGPAVPSPSTFSALAGQPVARLGLETLDLRWTANGAVDVAVETDQGRVERRSLAAGRCVVRVPGAAEGPATVRWRLHDGSRTLATGSCRTGYVQRGTLAQAAGLPAVGGPEVPPLVVAGGVVVAAQPGVLLCLEPRHGADGLGVAARWRHEAAVAAMQACEPDGLVVVTRGGGGAVEVRAAATGEVRGRVELGEQVGAVAGCAVDGGMQVWAVETSPPPPGERGVGVLELVRSRTGGAVPTLERGGPLGPGEPVRAALMVGRWFLAFVADDEVVELLVADALAEPGPRVVARWPMGRRSDLGDEESERVTLGAWAEGAVALLNGHARVVRPPLGGADPQEPPLVRVWEGDEIVPGWILVRGRSRPLVPLVVPVMEPVVDPVRVVVLEADPVEGTLVAPRRLGEVVHWTLGFCAGLSLVAAEGRLFTHVGVTFVAVGARTVQCGTGDVETRQPLVVVDGTLLGLGRQGQVLGLDLVDEVE